MLALTVLYSAFGVSPVLRGALYGLGPVLLGIFVTALYRLGKSALGSWTHALIAAAAAAMAAASVLGPAAILLLAGSVGVFLFHSRRAGAMALILVVLALAVAMFVPSPFAPSETETPTLGRIASLFAGIGGFTFGGGMSIIALMEAHVVHRLHWLTPREFIDGLALGQLTPGPIIMLGYKTLGIGGAVVGALASFLPSFVMMLALLPVFDRIRNLVWARAVIQGIVPGVIGVMAIVLVRLAPHAAPDIPAIAALLATTVVLMLWRVAPLKAMAGGALFGLVRDRVWGHDEVQHVGEGVSP
jgi:chromate transporter